MKAAIRLFPLVMVSLLAYWAGTLALGALVLAVCAGLGLSMDLAVRVNVFVWFVWRQVLFYMVGFAVGSKATAAGPARAATAGAIVSICLAVMESEVARIGLHAYSGPVRGHPSVAAYLLSYGLLLGLFGLQTGVSALGGWAASDRMRR